MDDKENKELIQHQIIVQDEEIKFNHDNTGDAMSCHAMSLIKQ